MEFQDSIKKCVRNIAHLTLDIDDAGCDAFKLGVTSTAQDIVDAMDDYTLILKSERDTMMTYSFILRAS